MRGERERGGERGQGSFSLSLSLPAYILSKVIHPWNRPSAPLFAVGIDTILDFAFDPFTFVSRILLRGERGRRKNERNDLTHFSPLSLHHMSALGIACQVNDWRERVCERKSWPFISLILVPHPKVISNVTIQGE